LPHQQAGYTAATLSLSSRVESLANGEETIYEYRVARTGEAGEKAFPARADGRKEQEATVRPEPLAGMSRGWTCRHLDVRLVSGVKKLRKFTTGR
jgi:hypothetical protein